jgi:AcrR family transcriptional regulator
MRQSWEKTMETLNPTQRRIHQAAFRLFAEKGTSQVNILDLAQEAGVARGTVYSNIESMEGLFEAVASHLAREMHERVNKSFDSLSDPAQRTVHRSVPVPARAIALCPDADFEQRPRIHFPGAGRAQNVARIGR